MPYRAAGCRRIEPVPLLRAARCGDGGGADRAGRPVGRGEGVVPGVLDYADGRPSTSRICAAMRSRASVDVIRGRRGPISTIDSGFEVDVFYVRAVKASRTGRGIRPRSLTVCPLARAHARTAAAPLAPRPRRRAPCARSKQPDTRLREVHGKDQPTSQTPASLPDRLCRPVGTSPIRGSVSSQAGRCHGC
jgi:hypothetical protein